MKINVGIFFGGKSVEHEISIISALQAVSNLNQEKYNPIPIYITKQNELYTGECMLDIAEYKDIPNLLIKSHKITIFNDAGEVLLRRIDNKKLFKQKKVVIDVAFPIVHGLNVEDGSLQGFLRMLDIPFVGSDVLSSSVAMNKYVSKLQLKAHDIPVLDCFWLIANDYFANGQKKLAEIQEKFNFPLIVKPIDLGSSVGISKAKNEIELQKALDLAFRFSHQVIIEPAIVNLKEINCAVLGDDKAIIVSECEEPVTAGEMLDYEAKYMSAQTKKCASSTSQGMASLKRRIPADIPSEMKEKIQKLAQEAFKILDCHGVVRIDFIIDTGTNEVYLNELNSIPGSLAFYLFEPIGMKYETLLDELIKMALRRKRIREEILYSFETNVLSMQKTFGAK
ncbi:MAG: D-alanine--D-alanine ligase [Clostridiales bacterium]|nr:D-alanine--D-alanine ligase [Clostridiales bacterium]